jgi:hypothetical protein
MHSEPMVIGEASKLEVSDEGAISMHSVLLRRHQHGLQQQSLWPSAWQSVAISAISMASSSNLCGLGSAFWTHRAPSAWPSVAISVAISGHQRGECVLGVIAPDGGIT